MADYQPKTRPEIFGLKPDMTSYIVDPPADYDRIMSHWQFKLAKPEDRLDFAHLFVTKQSVLQKQLPELKDRLKPAGMIWVSWPKKSSGVASEVTENDIRDFAIGIGLVDIKVCSVSDVWSGLKLVIPVKQRV